MDTDFELQAGEPFPRLGTLVIRVVGAKNIWATIDAVEVRSQLRSGESTRTALIANLHDYMTKSFDGEDLLVSWKMTGAQVRAIPKASGHFDIFVSDPGATDEKSLRILHGAITIAAAITSAAGDA